MSRGRVQSNLGYRGVYRYVCTPPHRDRIQLTIGMATELAIVIDGRLEHRYAHISVHCNTGHAA